MTAKAVNSCLLGCVGSLAIGVLLVLYHGGPSFSSRTTSNNISQSKKDGMYIGEYATDNKQISLRNGSKYTIGNVWIEHARVARVFANKRVGEGYWLHLSIGGQTDLMAKDGPYRTFILRYIPEDGYLSGSDKPSYSMQQGFSMHFEIVPERFAIEVRETVPGTHSWDDSQTTVSGFLQFERGF